MHRCTRLTCHCEAPKGPWRPEREARGSAFGVQSREGSCDFADGFPMIRHVPRDCHVGLRPPRNDKSGGLEPPNRCCNTCGCQRRSLSAATDAIGLCVLSMPCTPCKCLPEIATGAKRPRNDNSGAGTILTPSRSYRKCSAGPGCPLPAGRRGAALPQNCFPTKHKMGLDILPAAE